MGDVWVNMGQGEQLGPCREPSWDDRDPGSDSGDDEHGLWVEPDWNAGVWLFHLPHPGGTPPPPPPTGNGRRPSRCKEAMHIQDRGGGRRAGGGDQQPLFPGHLHW